MRLPLRAVSLVAATGLLAACAQTAADPRSTSPSTSLSTAMPTSIPAAKGEVTALAMVIEEDDGARVCLGGVDESLPPQRDGPNLVGFEWADVTSDEANGVEWAEPVRVTGTWDGTTMTLTEPAADEERSDTPVPALPTLCEEPDGGWVRDPDDVEADDLEAAGRLLDRRSDVLRAHVTYFGPVGDRLRTDAAGVDADGVDVTPSTIYNVVTTAPAAVKRALERVWGGGLCVVQGTGRSEAERRRIHEEIWRDDATPPGALSGGAGPKTVELFVIYDDGSIQRALDAEHGDGAVTVVSALQPVGAGSSTG